MLGKFHCVDILSLCVSKKACFFIKKVKTKTNKAMSPLIMKIGSGLKPYKENLFSHGVETLVIKFLKHTTDILNQ